MRGSSAPPEELYDTEYYVRWALGADTVALALFALDVWVAVPDLVLALFGVAFMVAVFVVAAVTLENADTRWKYWRAAKKEGRDG